MKNDEKEKSRFAVVLSKLMVFYRWIGKGRAQLNKLMKGRYTPRRIGVYAAMAVCLLWIIILFVPPYLGIADDGSLYKVMNRANLAYEEKNPENIYNNFYINKYLILNTPSTDKGLRNSQDLLVKSAIFIDKLFTGDQYFDLRFLALIYGVLYMPAVYLIVKYACLRVLYFSEAAFSGILGVIIFGDVSYTNYFSTLYPEALWIICLLYCAGGICRLQNKKGSFIGLLLIAVFGSILCISRQQCGIIGFILAGFCIKWVFLNKKMSWRVGCIGMAFVFSIVAMVSIFSLDSDFNITSKHHSMTRGVLFQAKDPEKALSEFGINKSYAVLAKTSAYDFYPFVLSGGKELNKGFYDKYTPIDIGLYYMLHPGSFLKMTDIAVKVTINLRRNFCGNYEKSAGMPKMAQSIFWSTWSNFKERNAPKTVGFLVLLLVLAFAFLRKRSRQPVLSEEERGFQIMRDMILVIACIGTSQAMTSIIMSGDTELTQHAFLFGAGMDLMTYYIFIEILRNLNLFQDRREQVR